MAIAFHYDFTVTGIDEIQAENLMRSIQLKLDDLKLYPGLDAVLGGGYTAEEYEEEAA